jgi:hypothetical protein
MKEGEEKMSKHQGKTNSVGTIVRALLLLPLVAAAGLQAQDAQPRVELHGFGGWTYARTDHNFYLNGTPEGNYRRTEFSLNIDGRVNDQLKIVAQGEWEQDETGEATHLIYAFAEWKVSDNLKLRGGQVKLPFGIYTEVIDVGTLRPFAHVPQGIYGPIGFAGEDYKGVGLTGSKQGRGGWRYNYDAYFGGMDVEEFHPPEGFLKGTGVGSGTIAREATRNVLGGRLVAQAPVEGLSFGGSAYTGTLNEPGSPRRWVLGVQGEYVSDAWSIRSELAREKATHDLTATGGYIEVARQFTPHWQGAVQLNRVTTSIFGLAHPIERSFLHHNEAALGLNYWFSRELVVKLAVHHINGNRFAGPAPSDYATQVSTGTLKHSMNLVHFGLNFTF